MSKERFLLSKFIQVLNGAYTYRDSNNLKHVPVLLAWNTRTALRGTPEEKALLVAAAGEKIGGPVDTNPGGIITAPGGPGGPAEPGGPGLPMQRNRNSRCKKKYKLFVKLNMFRNEID